MLIYFANNAVLDFGGFTSLKKREREASVSHSHFYCVDVSFVIKSVGANGFSYFL